MRLSTKKEDLNLISNAQLDYNDNLNKVINEYYESITSWANSIGCSLINKSLKCSNDFIIENYTDKVNKYLVEDNENKYKFTDMANHYKLGELCINEIRKMQDSIAENCSKMVTADLKLEEKNEFEISDNDLSLFKEIVENTISKLSDVYDDAKSDAKRLSDDNILAIPLFNSFEVQNGLISNYFTDQNNLYSCYLEWLQKNKDRIEALTQQIISDSKSKSKFETLSNQFKNPLNGIANYAVPFVAGMAASKLISSGNNSVSNDNLSSKNENNNSGDSESKNNDIKQLKQLKQKKLNRQKWAATIKKPFSALKNAGDEISKLAIPGIPNPLCITFKTIGALGEGTCDVITEWNDPKWDMRFDNIKGEDYKAVKKEIDDKNKIFDKLQGDKEFNEVLKINDNMSPEDRKKYYIDNSKEINEKIGKIIYNNQDYKYLFNMSDANLVKMGLADEYKKATGKDISNTPINFSPYLYNINNNNQPELAVKKDVIDKLNKCFDENKVFNKLNFDKIIGEISSIKGDFNDFKKEPDKKNFDGLVLINKESEMNNLIQAINGLTNSINSPKLLDSKNGRYNQETIDNLINSLKKYDNINEAARNFVNKQYGYAGYKDGIHIVDNYEDLNYAIRNKCRFRPETSLASKISSAQSYAKDINNGLFIKVLKSFASGVVNIGTTLLLSAINVPVGVAYGIGKFISSNLSPRDEYKKLLDNLGETVIDSLINDYDYDKESNEYVINSNDEK